MQVSRDDLAATELRFRGLELPRMPVTATSPVAEEEGTGEEGDDSEIDQAKEVIAAWERGELAIDDVPE
jgi:hypothetical protein